MHAVLQLGVQDEIDQALALDARLAREGGCDDAHVEMRFTPSFTIGAVAGMAHVAGMTGGIVLHLDEGRLECGGELVADQIFSGHYARVPCAA